MRAADALAGMALWQIEGIWVLVLFGVALAAWWLLQSSRKGL